MVNGVNPMMNGWNSHQTVLFLKMMIILVNRVFISFVDEGKTLFTNIIIILGTQNFGTQNFPLIRLR